MKQKDLLTEKRLRVRKQNVETLKRPSGMSKVLFKSIAWMLAIDLRSRRQNPNRRKF